MELFNVVFRTLFFYFFITLAYRIMGKREVGQLGIIDLIVSILIAELVAISIENSNDSIMLTIAPILLLVILSIIDIIYNINIWPIVLLLLIAVIMPTIIDLVNKIIFKREEVKKQKTFTKTISGIKASVIRGILSIASLPDKAYMSINAIIKTLYRILVSKKHFLEWVTAEEAEKNAKKDLKSYYTNMLPNVIFGILGIVLSFK